MNEIWMILLSALTGALVPIMIARYSKSKQERDAGLAVEYIKLADMTADHLEKKINLIDRLERRIKELDEGRLERDRQSEGRDRQIAELQEHNEALQAGIAGLKSQIERDVSETRELREKYESLKKWTRDLIEALEKKGLKLPELNGGPPDSIRGWKWLK